MDLINSLRDLIKHLTERNGCQQSAEQIKIRDVQRSLRSRDAFGATLRLFPSSCDSNSCLR